jgi:competence protein ComEA
MRFRRPLYVVGVATYVLMSASAVEAQEALPDAPGKAVLAKACSDCHEMETVIGSRRTKLGWQQIVDDMISRGAEGSKEDMEAVVAYLTTYFGKVNVNTATVQDLEKALDLSEKEAQAIVSYRERNTKIRDFEELKRVPGVSAETLQAKRGLIAFSL